MSLFQGEGSLVQAHSTKAKLLYFCKLAGSLSSRGKKSGTTPKLLYGPSLRHSLLSEMQTFPSSTTQGYFPWLKLPPRALATRSQRIQTSFPGLRRPQLMPCLGSNNCSGQAGSSAPLPPFSDSKGQPQLFASSLLHSTLFFFLLNLVFSQITSIDIFSLPENTDKKFSIPIIIFCCSAHGSSSSNRVPL